MRDGPVDDTESEKRRRPNSLCDVKIRAPRRRDQASDQTSCVVLESDSYRCNEWILSRLLSTSRHTRLCSIEKPYRKGVAAKNLCTLEPSTTVSQVLLQSHVGPWWLFRAPPCGETRPVTLNGPPKNQAPSLAAEATRLRRW